MGARQAALLSAFRYIDARAGEMNGSPVEPGERINDPDIIATDLAEAFGISFDERWPAGAADVAAREDFLHELRRVNADRWTAWAGSDTPDPLYQSNEFGGEAGEVQNVVKKLVREQRGWRGSRSSPSALAEEIADCIICLDTLARSYGIDLAAAVADKFNKTSVANDFPHRLFVDPAEREGQP